MAWYDDKRKYRLEIELSNAYNTNDLTDYMALLSANDAPANWRAHFYQNTEPNYGDVVVTASDGVTHVPHVFDANLGGDYMWLRVPTLTAAAPTVVYLYYGATGSTHPPESEETYPGYNAVYHLSDVTTTIEDSTANNNNGTAVGTFEQPNLIIGEGQAFDDTDYISVPHDDSLNITDDIWIQFWIDINTSGRVFDIVQKGNAFRIYMGGGGKINFVTGANTLTSGAGLSTGNTTKITCLRKNGVKYIYFNDTLDTSVAYSTPLSTNTDPLLISSTANPLDGTLDELQYGSLAPTYEAQHIEAEYQNELNHDTFTTFNAFELIPITGSGGISSGGRAARIIDGVIYPSLTITPMSTGGAADVKLEREYLWTYRIPITINAAQIPDGADLLNYPMLFDLDLPDDVQQHIGDYAYGHDFVFTDSDEQTKLAHEIEDYDPITGRMRAWVKIPVLPTTVDKTIWMYYRHSNVVDTEDLPATWSDYWAVYHLSIDPTSGSPQAFDSTENGNSMTGIGFVDSDLQAGIVDQGYFFDGVDNRLVTDMSYSYGNWDQITVEAWHYENINNTNVETIFAQSFDLNPSNGGAWFMGSKANNYRVQLRTEANDIRYEASGVITLNAWNYFAFTWNAADDLLTLYKDGAITGTPQTVVGTTLYDDLSVKTTSGATFDGSGYLNGRNDELRISKKEKPDHYFQTVDNNLRSPQTFVAVGQPEAHWRADGGMVLSYESSALNDRTIVFEYPGPIDTVHGPSGGITTTGTAEVDHSKEYYPTGGITVSYESDPLNDRTIELSYTASGGITITGIAEFQIGYIYVPTGGITVAYDSSALTDRTIVISYFPEPGGRVTAGTAKPAIGYVVLIIIPTTIPFELSYDSDPLVDRSIEFERDAIPSTLHITGDCDQADELVGLTYETKVASIITSYDSDPLNDRTIEFTPDCTCTPITASGTVIEPDEVNLIFEVDTSAALGLGGGDYYVVFERTMSGGITIGGTVPELDFILLFMVTIVDPIIISGTTDENETHVILDTQGGIKVTEVFNSYTIELSYDPKLTNTPRILGTTTAIIKANALFIYEPTGKAFFSFAKAETSYSQMISYMPSGRAYFRSLERPALYSYYPKYEYTATGVALTLLGGESYLGIKAIEPSGGIVLSDAGDITADEIQWIYKYTASGKAIFTWPQYSIPTLHYEREGIPGIIKIAGTNDIDELEKNYEYIGSGVIIIRQASIHRYTAFGGIIISGAVDTADEVKYNYIYIGSGQIKFTGVTADRSFAITPRIYIKKLLLTGTWNTEFILEYEASGGINIYDSDSTFKYISFEVVRLITSGSAGVVVDRVYIPSGSANIRGSAHYYLLEANTHKAYGTIYIGGTATSISSINFLEYIASGQIRLRGIAPFATQTFDITYSYEAAAGISINGLADTLFQPEFKYVAIIITGEIVIGGTAESLPESSYTASGGIIITGEADLAYRYDITGGIITSGSATYIATPTYKYIGTGRIKIVKIKIDYSKEYNYQVKIKVIKIRGAARYKAVYNYPPYITTGQYVISGAAKSTHSRIFNYTTIVAAVVTNGQSVHEYVVEKFYTGSGQANINGSSESLYNKIYGYVSTGEIVYSGSSITIGRKDVSYVGSGQLNGLGGSSYGFRSIILRMIDGEYSEEAGIVISEEPKAARVFRYDLTR